MNDEVLLLVKKHTDTLIEETKKKPQKTIEIKLKQQMQTFSCKPPINLSDGENWLLAVTLFEATNSV